MQSLLIDIGNTRLKWGLTNDAGLIAQRGAFPTTDLSGTAPTDWLLDGAAAERAIYVSVADDKTNRALETALDRQFAGRWTRFVSQAEVGGLRNAYARPSQVGADRLAAALGAWARIGDDCLVVNCGTATTIDLVRRATLHHEDTHRSQNFGEVAALAGGVFCGGLILPGLALMKSSLRQGTAGLPQAQGRLIEAPGAPDNTDDAIESGCLLAQLGAIAEMRHRLAAEAPLVLAGGAAPALRDALHRRHLHLVEAPEIVLEGLAVAILHGFARPGHPAPRR